MTEPFTVLVGLICVSVIAVILAGIILWWVHHLTERAVDRAMNGAQGRKTREEPPEPPPADHNIPWTM